MKKVFIESIDNIIINDEMLDLVSYSDINMKKTSLKAWSFLNQKLKELYNISIDKENIIYNEKGKPYLKNDNIYFNISHSKDLIAIIIDNKECGIDIEYIDYERKIDKLIPRVLSPIEQLKFNKAVDKYEYFYKIWTIKEAYLKYIGTGISFSTLATEQQYTNIISYICKYKKNKYYVSETK